MRKMKDTFYITTTLPYVNAMPHIGFASEVIYADVRARWARQDGYDVVFNTGTDEHGVKIWQKAQEDGIDAQSYVDDYAQHFKSLRDSLNLSYTHFIRTTDAQHKRAAQELWRRVDANGFIYKKHYQVKYCVGCELEKTDSELENGRCALHPNKDVEIIEEENYFFRFSAFEDELKALFAQYSDFVVPSKRFNEIRSLLDNGLQDFSISRVREKMPWGIPVPGDDAHVMYVWFDALTNYISTLGWPDDTGQFEKFWGFTDAPRALQIAGKDNLRQQSAMWQAMLLAAELPTSRKIFINGFISVDGQKMSKSLGNVIAPDEMVKRYGTDGTRYLLMTKGAFGEDTDISWEKMDARYNAELANGLGNLVSRVVMLAGEIDVPDVEDDCAKMYKDIRHDVERMELRDALENVWRTVRDANKYIEETKPWALRKNDAEQFEVVMKKLLGEIAVIANILDAFLPETAHKITESLKTRQRSILFERISD